MNLIQIKVSFYHVLYTCSMLTPAPRTLDVRPLLKEGREPLTAIIEAKSCLEADQTLILLAPFEPQPLYARFEAEGFLIEADRIDNNDWEIRFIPSNDEADKKMRQLDLRGLDAGEIDRRGLKAVACLEREKRLELLTSERPATFLSELNAESTDYDCEPDAHKLYWVTTIWRR